MSHRIWLRYLDVGFMSTQTIDSEDEAERVAESLARSLPEATVGVDRVERVSCRHRIGEDVRRAGQAPRKAGGSDE